MPVMLLTLLMLTADPWADAVVLHVPGMGGSPGYDDPTVCLGPPERFTGEASAVPSVVSPFSPAWGVDEVLSLGVGGTLVLRFDTPVRDDTDNPFGIDLLLFGNSGLTDGAYPAGICSGIFGADGGIVEVSQDGVEWHVVDVEADAPWPTIGWLDAGPYDNTPGTQPADVVRPIDPAEQLTGIIGQPYDAIVQVYGGSGGGTGIDLADVSLASISFVRITVPDDAFVAPEIDAIVDVGRWGDANGDHVISVDDVLAVVGQFGATGVLLADRNFDGVVGVSDLLIVLETWP